MDLVDYIYLVFSGYRGNTDLLGKSADVIDRVVAGSIQLEYVVRAQFCIETPAGLAFSAGFSVRTGMLAIDGLGEQSGAGGLADTARTAEKV